MQALEEHLGAPLFDRIGRKLKLTDVGKKLLPYTKEILETYGKIESITRDEENMSGELKISAPESLTVYRLEPILREYRKKFPHVSISLSNATCGDNKRAIQSGSADIAFLMMPQLQDSDLIVHSLLAEPIVLVGSPDCSLNILDKSYENQKLSECLIVNEEECSYRKMFEEYLEERGIIPSHTMKLWSVEAMKRCVMSGLGIACLPLIAVNDEIKEGKLKVIPCDGDFYRFLLKLLTTKTSGFPLLYAMFIDITLKHARDWSYTEVFR